jgi:hypothetical protein
MAPQSWHSWSRWNSTIAQTLDDAQKAAAGDESVAQKRKLAGDDGTRSVLDVYSFAQKAEAGKCWVLSAGELHQHFGSKLPTKKVIESGLKQFLETLERGEAVAVTAYVRGAPSAVLFAGWPSE